MLIICFQTIKRFKYCYLRAIDPIAAVDEYVDLANVRKLYDLQRTRLDKWQWQEVKIKKKKKKKKEGQTFIGRIAHEMFAWMKNGCSKCKIYFSRHKFIWGSNART